MVSRAGIDSAGNEELSRRRGWVVGWRSMELLTVLDRHTEKRRLQDSLDGLDHPLPEYLTTSEAAALLRLKPKTLRNKVAAGVFVEGQHYFRKAGLGPRWKQAALILWLEGRESLSQERFELAQPGGREVA